MRLLLSLPLLRPPRPSCLGRPILSSPPSPRVTLPWGQTQSLREQQLEISLILLRSQSSTQQAVIAQTQAVIRGCRRSRGVVHRGRQHARAVVVVAAMKGGSKRPASASSHIQDGQIRSNQLSTMCSRLLTAMPLPPMLAKPKDSPRAAAGMLVTHFRTPARTGIKQSCRISSTTCAHRLRL